MSRYFALKSPSSSFSRESVCSFPVANRFFGVPNQSRYFTASPHNSFFHQPPSSSTSKSPFESSRLVTPTELSSLTAVAKRSPVKHYTTANRIETDNTTIIDSSDMATPLDHQSKLGTLESRNFIEFLNKSPTAYHAVKHSVDKLESAGFTRLSERTSWSESLQKGGKYFITRNQSSLIAFTIPENLASPADLGEGEGGVAANIVGCHTDSCHFRVRPRSKKEAEGFLLVGVETYGGGLWQTWVDRDLTLAGRVFLSPPKSASSSSPTATTATSPHSSILVHLPITHPILRIPTLAVHLNRDGGGKQDYNLETELQPVLGLKIKEVLEKNLNDLGSDWESVKSGGTAATNDKSNNEESNKTTSSTGTSAENPPHHPALLRLLSSHLSTILQSEITPDRILDFDLALADTQPAVIGGIDGEFIFGGRLDNLFSSFCAVEGLVRSVQKGNQEERVAATNRINLIALWDNEEIGSVSAFGAESNFISSVMRRLSAHPLFSDSSSSSPLAYESFLARSFLLSTDMGHSIHPSFPAKHEVNHKPLMNGGPAIKTNAKMRYASTGETRTLLKRIADLAQVPLQEYEVRNDMGCGSTIGPLVSQIGLRTVDIGCTQLSMHSIRETAGTKDVTYLAQLFQTFFERFGEVDNVNMLGE